MLIARRREISLVRLVPTTARRCSSAWALASVFWSQDASGSLWSWITTAGLALPRRDDRPRARHPADGARARRRDARAAVDLARRRGARRRPAGHAVPLPRHPGQHRPAGADPGHLRHPQHARLRRGHRPHHIPDRVPHAVRARRGVGVLGRARRAASRHSATPPPCWSWPSRSDWPSVRSRSCGTRGRRAARPCSGRSAASWSRAGDRLCGAASDHRAARRRIGLLDAGQPVEHDGRLPPLQAGAGLGMVRAVEPERVPVQRDQLRAAHEPRDRAERVLRRAPAARLDRARCCSPRSPASRWCAPGSTRASGARSSTRGRPSSWSRSWWTPCSRASRSSGFGWLLLVLCAVRAGQSRSWRERMDAGDDGAGAARTSRKAQSGPR